MIQDSGVFTINKFLLDSTKYGPNKSKLYLQAQNLTQSNRIYHCDNRICSTILHHVRKQVLPVQKLDYLEATAAATETSIDY